MFTQARACRLKLCSSNFESSLTIGVNKCIFVLGCVAGVVARIEVMISMKHKFDNIDERAVLGGQWPIIDQVIAGTGMVKMGALC